MKPEFLEYINTGLLSMTTLFIMRFLSRIDKTEKKVEDLDNRVLKIETVDQTRKEMKKELKAGYVND